MIKHIKVNWPKDMEALENKAAEVIAKILINKLQPEEVEQLVKILEEDKVKINM